MPEIWVRPGSPANWPVTACSCHTGVCGRARGGAHRTGDPHAWPVDAGSAQAVQAGPVSHLTLPRCLQVIGRRSLALLLAVARVERNAKQERGGLGSVRLEIDVGEGHIGFRVGPGHSVAADLPIGFLHAPV